MIPPLHVSPYMRTPPPSPHPGSEADVMRKQLSSVTASSTPIFTLLMQLFQVNAAGCLRMIQLRKAHEAELLKTARQRALQTTRAATMSRKRILARSRNAQQPQASGSEKGANDEPRPQIRRQAPPSQIRSSISAQKPKTVFELLKEKRMQQSKAHRSTQNTIVSPQISVIHAPIPAGQPQTPTLSVASPTSQNALLPSLPFVPLPTCQVMATNNIACNQISSASSDSRQGEDADKNVAVAQDAGATSKCNSAPSIGSPCGVQAVPGFQNMASNQVPMQLLQRAVIPAATTWIVTPQGLVQALFPTPSQATMNLNSAVSESIPAVDLSSHKVPETPTILSSTVNHQLPESKGSTELENTAWEAAKLHCDQPAKLPLSTLPPTLIPPNKATQFTLTPKKYPVVKIAKILPPNQPKAGTCNVENGQTPAPPQTTTTQASTSSTEKNITDLSLISLEDENSVKDWLQGKSGMAYLPPSATTLMTFSRILLQKKTLEESALKLVPRSDGDVEDLNKKKEILDNLVEEKLKDNLAFDLLKQRFLCAFTFPGLLSVFTPPNTKPPVVKSEVKDEDNVIAIDKDVSHADNNIHGHSGGEAPGLTAPASPKEGEALNPDTQLTPMDVSDNTEASQEEDGDELS